jgi:hypothetical protein
MTAPKESLQSPLQFVKGETMVSKTRHIFTQKIYIYHVYLAKKKTQLPWYITILVYTDTVQYRFDLRTLGTLEA